MSEAKDLQRGIGTKVLVRLALPTILFMLLYAKNEAEDLTPDEKRQVTELARQFREETIHKGKPS